MTALRHILDVPEVLSPPRVQISVFSFCQCPHVCGIPSGTRRFGFPASRPRRRQPIRWSVAPLARVGQDGRYAKSSALNREDSVNRYIDLRTMKVIPSNDAHVCPMPPVDVSFGVFDNPEIFSDPRRAEKFKDALFTPDTVPLSDSQKQVIEALLSRRSVLHVSCAFSEKDAILVDIVLRNRLWKGCILYCASSRRSAESVYAMLCAQLGPERRAEVRMDMGDDGSYDRPTRKTRDSARVVITLPHVLRAALITCSSDGWISDTSLAVIDGFSLSDLDIWEEVLLSLPSRILLCIFAKDLGVPGRELLPLWLETIHNSVVSISPAGAASLLDRFERPQGFPLLRTFAFNAAIHKSPVQVSLTLLKDMLLLERDDPSGNFIPRFEECFLRGTTTIPADDPQSLTLGGDKEAEYADVSCLVVADAKRTEGKAKLRAKRRAKVTKKRERTASSRAAARRRREAAYAESLLFPAVVLIKGRYETSSVCRAIRNALKGNATLLWDEDSRRHLQDIVLEFRKTREGDLSDDDRDALQKLVSGIGVVHSGLTAGVRTLSEEAFRAGFIPLLVADTHIGSTQISALAAAKSVMLESSALGMCDDTSKGIIMASTAAALCGRPGKDDVGNLIVSWYDESVDDDWAGREIASTLLYPILFEHDEALCKDRTPSFSSARYLTADDGLPRAALPSGLPDSLSCSYDGILRSLRRFGVDGYKSVLDYTLYSYKGWLERASLHATIEKLNIEKRTIDDTVEREDWAGIADHERRCAKWNEARRVFVAMQKRFFAVLSTRICAELRRSPPGRIIGVQCSKSRDGEVSATSEQKLLDGAIVPAWGSSLSRNFFDRPKSAGSSLQLEKSEAFVHNEGISAAVFIALRDQAADGNGVKTLNSVWQVVCILADGMWTIVPLEDVVTVSDDETKSVQSAALLSIPHPATFDLDPVCGWAKCRPIDDMEEAAVHKVSDELMASISSLERPAFGSYQIPEFEAQRGRLNQLQALRKQSPWYGRDEELQALHLLRRRSAELGDEILSLQDKENRLEDNLYLKQKSEAMNQESVMAVLEDCHAVSVLGDLAMEMTPIGTLGSVLPGRYPLFAAACLSLIDKAEDLSPAEFAAYVAAIVGAGRMSFSNVDALIGAGLSDAGDPIASGADDSEWEFSSRTGTAGNFLDLQGMELAEEDSDRSDIRALATILPTDICSAIGEIMLALQQLHRRHRDEKGQTECSSIVGIAPTVVNFRVALAMFEFASGCSWEEVTVSVPVTSECVVNEFRNVKSVLNLVADGREGEFSAQMQKLAGSARDMLSRWPVSEGAMVLELVDAGMIERVWGGTTYDKWWRSVRDSVATLNGVAGEEGPDEVKSVEAEILES